MSVIEEISRLSEDGCDDDVLLNYIYENHDELECELNGDEFKEPKKHKRNFCIDCNLEMLIYYQKSVLVCTNCGLFTYFPVYVTSYNHPMKPVRRKCVYKRYDSFKTILNQFFYSGMQLIQDNVMNAIRDEIRNRDNILYNYTIPLTIPILECILKRYKMLKYKNSIYFIFFKLKSQPLPYITITEKDMMLNMFNIVSNMYDIFFKLKSQPLPYITITEKDMMLNMFNIVSNIYDKYKPKGRKSFLNYSFV